MNIKVEHGGNIYKMAERIGCQPEEILDFSSNINPIVPNFNRSIDDKKLQCYADPNYQALYEVIAMRFQLDINEVKLFNGASAAIFALCEQLDFKEMTLYAPLYGEYKVAAKRYHKSIHLINRLDDIWEKPTEGSLVVFVNPSTPDGRVYDFDALLHEWKALQCTVIIDESFLEFTSKPSLRGKIKEYDNLYIIQSFTKFYACAGLRIGAVFSLTGNIEKLFTPMWPLSSVDALFLTRLLEDKEHLKKSQEVFSLLLQRLRFILCESMLFDEVYPSESNYILTRSEYAYEIEQRLLESKIMVRNCADFDFLDARYLRFAVKDDKALDSLEKALGSIHE